MYWNSWLSNTIIGEQYRIMQKEKLSTTAASAEPNLESVELNLRISGKREQILTLLEQMVAVPGFSVLKGSFVVSAPRNTSM